MEKKNQSKVTKKTILSQKPKVGRPKVTGVKSRVKAAPLKQKTAVAILKNQGKTRPAPIPEPGFAMYSTDSEDAFSFCNEKNTCAQVLTMLRNKHKVNPSNRKTVTCSSDVKEKSADSTEGPNQPAPPPIVIPCVTNDGVIFFVPFVCFLVTFCFLFCPSHTLVNPSNRKTVTCSSDVKEKSADSTEGPNQPAPPPIVIPCVTNDDTDSHPGPVSAFSVLSGGNTPFNDRLASSTPDPDRPQIIPERDTNSAHKIPFRGYTMGIQKEQYFPATNSHLISNHGYRSAVPSGGEGFRSLVPPGGEGYRSALPSGGEGFSPGQGFVCTNDGQNNSWEKRDSDIGAFQAYIARESTGFTTVPVSAVRQVTEQVGAPQAKNQSGSSGEKSSVLQSSQNTGNSSGTEYIYLPQPVGTADSQDRHIPAGFQYQNGLYQIRPHGPLTAGAPGEERQIHDAQLIPVYSTQIPDHSNFVWEIPERDNAPMKSPRHGHVMRESVPDTISTIDGSVSGTFEPLTPRSTVTESTNTFNSASESKSVKKKPKVTSSKPKQTIKGKKQNPTLNDCTESKTVSFQTQTSKVSGENTTGSQNVQTTVSFQTQTSQISSENTTGSHSVHSTGTLYHLIHTDKGKELVPVSLVHYPSFVNIPGGVHQDGKGQGHISQGQGETNIGRPVTVATNDSELAGLKHQSLDLAVTNQEQTIPNPWSGVRLDAGMKRVRYLLGEMKECGKINKDVEIGRLAKEVEKSLDSIPQLSATFSLQAELDLALQPLRNENAQLRRKLRLANQNMRDHEQEKEKGTGVDFDVLHLQASNTGLQRQVKEEMEDKVKLAAEVANQHNEIQRMKVERNKLLAALSEKETDELKVKQECLMDAQKFRKEVETMNRQIEAIQLQQEASDQENHILQVSLQQRDAEIDRLQEMVQDMKSCVNELMEELDEAGDNAILSTNCYGLQKNTERYRQQSTKIKVKPSKSILSPARPTHTKTFTGAAAGSATTSRGQVSGSHGPVTGSRDPVSGSHGPVTGSRGPVAGSRGPVTGSRGPVTGSRGPVKNLRFDPREMNRDDDYHPPAKLTEQALASHNRSLGREEKGRNSDDTRREFTRNDYIGAQGRVLPRQRRRSSSPHGRRESHEGRHRRALSSSPRQIERMSLIESEIVDRSLVDVGQERVNILHDNIRPVGHDNRVGYLRDSAGIKAWGQQVNFESNRSDAEQSRYSVTDYFRKYKANDDSYKGPSSHPWSTHQRTRSQPAGLVLGTAPSDYSDSRFAPNTDSNYKHSHVNTYSTRPQLDDLSQEKSRSARGEYPVLDNSISAIDDDNISSVSGSGKASSTTVTDKTFRKGIATLDANILKLQLALQRTKSMLS
ncbi:uncharacterized protein [Argopecten irradians]|uniref:uncharacterized protein n=1 Tax=Argopecten irradians TaxID=31199 RepID=UPI00371C03BE